MRGVVEVNTLEERFWSRVDKRGPDDCWEWQGSRDKHGYGKLFVVDKEKSAHRIAWTISNSDPGKLSVCHRCDNPPCCNPAHLFVGTPGDNNRDARQKGRGCRSFEPQLAIDGRVIRMVRITRGVSVKDLASAILRTPNVIVSIESGYLFPTLKEMDAIKAVLQWSSGTDRAIRLLSAFAIMDGLMPPIPTAELAR